MRVLEARYWSPSPVEGMPLASKIHMQSTSPPSEGGEGPYEVGLCKSKYLQLTTMASVCSAGHVSPVERSRGFRLPPENRRHRILPKLSSMIRRDLTSDTGALPPLSYENAVCPGPGRVRACGWAGPRNCSDVLCPAHP